MKYLIATILMFTSLIIEAQNLSIQGVVDNQEVKLRWSADQVDIWEEGNITGYSLTRYTVMENELPLDSTARANSKVVLSSSILPDSETQINANIAASLYDDAELADILIQVLYSGNIVPNPTPASGQDIRDNQEIESDRFFFVSIASDRDYQVALSAGLAYEDNTITATSAYEYVIALSIGSETYTASTFIDGNAVYDTSGPINFKAYGANQQIELRWTKLDAYYYAYDVYRSTDGAAFDKINDAPYSFTLNGDIEEIPAGTIVYLDSIDQNGVDYHYKVQGISPFGYKSVFSDVQIIQGIAPPVEYELNLVVESVSEINVDLSWNAPNDPSIVDHYDLFRSKFPTHGFEQVNDIPLPAGTLGYADFDGIGTYYYIVVMEDIHGHKYKSQSKLAQGDDITPPATPTGLSVVPDHSGEITITWNANTEHDLSGYRIYRSNMGDGSFFDVSKRSVKGTEFKDYVDTEVLTNKICYKILASDNRGNYSPLSAEICVDRPDHVGPSNPVLFGLFATRKGIKLTWELSTSEDLASHTLQRKRKDGVEWTDVVSWDPQSPIHTQKFGSGYYKYNYLDQSKLEPVTHQYRLVAYDTEGNNSTSQVKTVRPMPSKSSTPIENFNISASCSDEAIKEYLQILQSLQAATTQISGNINQPTGVTATTLINLLAAGGITMTQYSSINGQTNQQINAFLNNQIQNVQDKLYNENCVVSLSWKYEEDFKNISAIEIYKGNGFPQNTPTLVRVIPKDEIDYLGSFKYLVLDIEVAPKIAYDYKVMMIHTDGTESEFTKIKTILVNP